MAVTTEELLAAAARAAAGDDFETLYAIDAELLRREAAGLAAVTDEELIECERAAATVGGGPVITGHCARQSRDPIPVDAAAEDASGPFVVVTGSGDLVPDCPSYDDRALAVQACDLANRRAARVGRPPAYRIVPAHPADQVGPAACDGGGDQ